MSASPLSDEPAEECHPTPWLSSYYAHHDWRLLSRTPIEERRGVGYHETWYCTRCRRVEERKTR